MIPTPEQQVYVVDDDPNVREATELMLQGLGYRVCAFDNAFAFLENVASDARGCLVLDVRMPGMSGMSLQREMNERGYLMPIVFLTGHADISMAVEAIREGAVELLEKPYRANDLLDAINAALTTELAWFVDDAGKEEARARLAKLEPRERIVLEKVIQGEPNRQIAEALGLSERRIEQLRSAGMQSLGVNNVPDLLRLFDRA